MAEPKGAAKEVDGTSLANPPGDEQLSELIGENDIARKPYAKATIDLQYQCLGHDVDAWTSR